MAWKFLFRWVKGEDYEGKKLKDDEKSERGRKRLYSYMFCESMSIIVFVVIPFTMIYLIF